MQSLSAIMIGSALPSTVFARESNIQDAPGPVHIPASGGKRGKIGDGDIVFKLSSSQTAGNLGISESVLPVGLLGAPPHSHKNFDEICRVTEGVLNIMVGDQVFEVKAGDWHLRPRGIVHTFWNSGAQPAKFIELYVPGGHEAYMQALADMFIGGKRPQPGALEGLAKKFDINFDWAMLKAVMDKYKVHL
ncbi:cupin domain-containing protein [Pedobacter sp. Leaf176]|uniref:cupin domain-containing protein n=1 Tax=Pedobacter sp. Leaf176 TaxID=1736286 RepID=UPI0018D1F83D|nr:cupin domain-containing protein [Pedobacter sp. Leaf176]